MVYSKSILLLATLVGAARAANDWSVPCVTGSCEYDLPDGASSGTMKVWGNAGAITDITTAAGWEIVDCSPDALSQNIRLVCNTADERSEHCQNLFEGVGPEGKLVRLPENCGASAFARIKRSWVSEDQSLPPALAKRLVRRQGETPEVRALAIDTNFAAVDPAAGPVNIAIRGANVPGAGAEIVPDPAVVQARSHPRQFNKRFFGQFVRDAIDAITGLNTFDVNQSSDLPSLDINENFNLFQASFGCDPVEANVSVDVRAKARAAANIGIAGTGTIIPPDFSDIGIVIGFNADIDGGIKISANAVGTLDSGKIQLFQIGIPGLDFPGILTVGPSFAVDAQAVASLDVALELDVGLKYSITDGQLAFPPNPEREGGNFNVQDTPLQLALTPSASATGRLEAHLIPSINLGLSALGNFVEAKVFLNLDAAAILELTLTASTTTNIVARQAEYVPRGMYHQPKLLMASPQDENTNAVGSADGTEVVPPPAPEVSVGGCFNIIAGLSVNAGAEGNFFNLFNGETSIALFAREFNLFQRCFGDQAPPARRAIEPGHSGSLTSLHVKSVEHKARQLGGLLCPAPDTKPAEPVANETVAAANITPR